MLSVEQFVADYLLLGLPSKKKLLAKKAKEGIEQLCHRVNVASILGATFDSLRAGLAIPPKAVIDEFNRQKQAPITSAEIDAKPNDDNGKHVSHKSQISDDIGKLVEFLEKRSDSDAASVSPIALSKDAAAEYLGVERKTIDNLIRQRRLEHVKIGTQRGYVIPIKSLEKFVEQNTQITGEEERRKRKRK